MNKYFFKILPFLLFFSTYIMLIYYYQSQKIIVPKLIGTLLVDINNINNDNLIIKVSKVTYNKEYEDNYIIGQYPAPGSLVRSNQVISLEVNNNKNQSIKKNFNNNSAAFIKDFYREEGILYKEINFQKNIIFNIYDKKKNITYLYFMKNIHKPKIYIKNLVGESCSKIFSYANLICYDINNVKIESCNGCEVINQFPLPGQYELNEENIKIHVWHKEKSPCNI